METMSVLAHSLLPASIAHWKVVSLGELHTIFDGRAAVDVWLLLRNQFVVNWTWSGKNRVCCMPRNFVELGNLRSAIQPYLTLSISLKLER